MIALRALSAFVFRAPIETPVRTSFGIMHERPAVFVRAEDRDGTVGWGEVWCNFPSVGAEHRARLVESVLSPLLLQKEFSGPEEAFRFQSEKTAVLAIQSGEAGPLAQAIAGVDIALWDLHARRLGQPLWRVLGGTDPSIAVYASGLNPDAPEKLAAAKKNDGYRAFKLKVGFGAERDVANLRALRETLGAVRLMVDANQGWSVEEACAMLPRLEPFGLRWLEEPLRADVPWEAWRKIRGSVPLAAGENVCGMEGFQAAIASGVLGVVQPDLAKWGGFSGCLPVAKRVRAAGLVYCPHYLGGGIGLLASAHLLAAVGGDGMLEIDANPNPLRERLCAPLDRIEDGRARLSGAPGLGDLPDPRETLGDFLRG